MSVTYLQSVEMKLGSKYDLFDTPAIWNANRFAEVKYLQSAEKIQWKF